MNTELLDIVKRLEAIAAELESMGDGWQGKAGDMVRGVAGIIAIGAAAEDVKIDG